MNIFKALDLVFPTGNNRIFGEVVHTQVVVHVTGHGEGLPFFNAVSAKRKAQYVNASVNAFHMHRELCRELTKMLHSVTVPDVHIRRAKRLTGLATLTAYLENRKTGNQFHLFHVILNKDNAGGVSMWWESELENPDSWREICEQPDLSLADQVELGAVLTKLSLTEE
jgi:hypothetical protein